MGKHIRELDQCAVGECSYHTREKIYHHGKTYSRVRSVCGWRVIIPYMGKYIRELDQCAVGE